MLSSITFFCGAGCSRLRLIKHLEQAFWETGCQIK